MRRTIKIQKIYSPLEEYNRTMKVCKFCSAFVGVDVTDPNYKMNWITAITVSTMVIYFSCTAFFITEDWSILLEALCMVGSVLQGMGKLYSAVNYKSDYCNINVELQGLYGEYQTQGAHYVKSLHYRALRIQKILKFVGVCLIVAFILMVSPPLYKYFCNNERLLILHFHIPTVDINTNFGYFITFSVHMLCMVIGTSGNYAGDMFAMIYLAHSKIFVDIFQHKVTTLNELVEVDGAAKDPKAMEMLMDIVKFHKIYLEYMKRNNRCFNIVITTQMTTVGISITLTLFVVLTSNWTGGCPYLFYCFLCMYLYCFLGTEAEICNDEFIDEIYKINWYNLTVPQQKTVRLMLMKAQTAKQIEIAGVIELSVNTGLKLTKNIYSIFMMMVQFLSE